METEKDEQPTKFRITAEKTISETEAKMRLAAAYRLILEVALNNESKDKPKEEV